MKQIPNTEEKIIIISDTHFGSIYENLDYLKYVYEYATLNNIKTILHAGDLIQSTKRNVKKNYRDEYNQICHVIESYPKDSIIQNYILFGNHDYHTLKKDPKYLKLLSNRKDFNLLGTKRSYLTWHNQTISLIHHTPKFNLEIPNLETLVNFCGHTHKLSIHDKSIHVPTLSDDLKDSSLPGFLVATIKSNILFIEHIYFEEKNINSELIYKEHLKLTL